MRNLLRLLFILLLCFALSGIALSAEQPLYPDETWMQYATPEEAGFSSEKLELAKNYFKKIKSAALLVIYDGAVVASWGEVERRFLCHSIRKSYLSALYGIYTEQGKINLKKTMGELGITENNVLTEVEKKARIIDLLKARSGIYVPSSAETPYMEKSRPARGSHDPDTFWYYNNWDFNVLGTIFEQETGKKIFEAYKEKIAGPLKMQDYRIMDGFYQYDKGKSIYPAYPFKMSARDMARFGLLYLRKGKWQDKQIISERWIAESVTPYSVTPEEYPYNRYGYLWWISGDMNMYSALGSGGHSISIIPEEKLVIVHRVNTYERKAVNGIPLLKRIIAAKISSPKPDPKLIPLPSCNNNEKLVEIDEEFLEKYAGKYTFPDGSIIDIVKENNYLILKNPNFVLLPISQTKFIVEDSKGYLEFKDNANVVEVYDPWSKKLFVAKKVIGVL